jgi:WD40 repeat protein
LVLKGHTAPVVGADFSPDGRLVVTASSDKTARLWEAETGKEVRVLKGHTSGVFSAVFSPDGKRLATVGDGYDITFTANGFTGGFSSTTAENTFVRIWDVATDREPTTLRWPKGTSALSAPLPSARTANAFSPPAFAREAAGRQTFSCPGCGTRPPARG